MGLLNFKRKELAHRKIKYSGYRRDPSLFSAFE
jgi:hypothetical protein